MSVEATFVILFAIATGVAILTRHLRIPYTVALVVVGLALGSFHLMEAPHLTKELLFAVFLPGLLFDAAFNLDAREFWRNRLAIGALSVPGVLVVIVITGFIVAGVIRGTGLDSEFTWRHGLVFGALVAATDPIAVVGLFRHLNAPARLRVLVEGESLLNDGTSIVLFTLILAFVSGVATSASDLLVRFASIVGAGALVGAVIGVAASRVIARVDDAMIEITLTTIAAWGAFIIGEQLHFSGVIATVTAGMVCGNYGRRIGMSPSTQLAVQTFWEYVAFALNSVIFLLIGFEVGLGSLAASWRVIAVAFLAVLAARAVVIFGMTLLLRRSRESIPLKWGVALTWGGLRGALSMVLALSLAAGFPERSLLVTMTFGVVVASILVQGISMPWVLRGLGLVRPQEDRLAHDIARGDLQVAAAAEQEIARMRLTHDAPPAVLDALKSRYESRGDQAREALSAYHGSQQQFREEATITAIEHLLLVEKAELLDRLRSGLVPREAFEKLASDVDARLLRLRSGQFTQPEELVMPLHAHVPGGRASADAHADAPAHAQADASSGERPAPDREPSGRH
jgi:CPA1 family monovalent cation:H+ antiporter